MKQFFLSIILITGLSALVQSFLPWWSMIIAAFAIGFLIPQKREASWFAGLIAIFTLWLAYAIVLSKANNEILAARLAELFHPLTGGKIWRIYFMVGAVGSLTGAFASLTGRMTALMIFPKQWETA